MGSWERAGVNPRALTSLPSIRKSVTAGEMHLADSLISADFFGSSGYYGHFTSIGDLLISFTSPGMEVNGYLRELDLSTSLGKVNFMLGGVRYSREYFCSYPDRVLAMRFEADRAEAISFNLGFEVVQDSSLVITNGNRVTLFGWIDGNHRPFVVSLEVDPEGGTVTSQHGELVVENADRVDLFLTIATNYRMEYPHYTGEDPAAMADSILSMAVEKGYDQLREKHIQDYQSLYDRVSFELPGIDSVELLSTGERFKRLKSGMEDPGYAELVFNLGRYMIISSSRQGTLPANLQGVWNTFKVAPWAGNYQSNINIQEIYWSCGPTDLAECQQPYIDWIEDLAMSGEEVARRVYGTGGWVSHTTGNIWGHAAPIGNHPWGMYPMGAAWHCQHVWDQYAFTGDLDYLRKQAYPLLKGASQFWLENLIPFEGYLITAPSVSAEHGALVTPQGLDPAHHDFRSDKYVYSIPGIYQDMEMIWDLFTNTAEAATLLGDGAYAQQLLDERERLLPLKIGKYGQLQEWYEDIDSPECHHRHIAHLYAVCPGRQIHPVTTPQLAAASKVALNMRGDGRYMEQELASGGNWARAHRMWCWTRLADGDRALKIMKEMLTEQGFENGLTYQHASYHWEREDLLKEGDLFCHFQLDGSASVPGCIAEMLLQSHMGEIQLLPALPGAWPNGNASGLKARGGYRISIRWEDGSLVEASIKIPPGGSIPSIRLKNQLIDPGSDSRIQLL
jgi:alpha-L-fucosidase 2